MIRDFVSASLLAWCIVSAGFGAQARAQQFSADIARTPPDAQAALAGKLFVSGSKVRIETSDVSDGYFLVDARTPVSYFVRPRQHVFMDARQSSQLTQLLVPVNLDDPCRQWQAMSAIADANGQGAAWTCQRLSHGDAGQRDVIGYQVSSAKIGTMRAWIDPQLKWPVRLIMANGATIELKNIQEHPQPARLFQVPSDYRKFDPKALLERIKQSDVWVEPLH